MERLEGWHVVGNRLTHDDNEITLQVDLYSMNDHIYYNAKMLENIPMGEEKLLKVERGFASLSNAVAAAHEMKEKYYKGGTK